MAYDGRLLASARLRLEEIKQNNTGEHERRVAAIHAKIPEIAEIDGSIGKQMAGLFRLTLSKTPDIEKRIAEFQERITDMQMRRAELLTEHGYPIDYLDEIYACPDCRDTGSVNGRICACLDRLYNAELTKSLGSLIQTGDESFDNFDPTLYPASGSGTSPRDVMVFIANTCRDYADNFAPGSRNLLLQGGPGLGKTYLAACIARTVSAKGFSVYYDTASTALTAFENQKFARDAETAESAGEAVSGMLECDLMILDDLGTEMITSFSVSALYTLINTRLLSKRPVIICTALTDEELKKKYSPQVASRISGEFLKLPVVGEDIRRKKQ